MSGLGIFLSLFFIYNAGALPFPVQWQRGLYVLVTYVLILIVYPMASTKSGPLQGIRRRFAEPYAGPGPADLVLIVVSTVAVGYYILNFSDLQFRAGAYTQTDFAVALAGLCVSIEVARRVLGRSMTLIGVFFLGYLMFGHALYDIPVLEVFAHRGRSLERAATILYFDQEGVFGVMANVLVSYVVLFIFFGAFLRTSGADRFFIDLPMAVAGKSPGGPAKVSVLASSLFGSISGSAIANTVSTGAFTIPLMKKAGFRPHVAGAIEPAASIGGMFMPPVMGAGAFLMSELTGISYGKIVLASIFPAILYFTSVLTMVHFEALKEGIRGTESVRSVGEILKSQYYLALPLLVIIVLMIAGFSPGYAAFWGILSCLPLMYLKAGSETGGRKRFLSTLRLCREALELGARDTLVIGATVGVIGIIVGTIYTTGVGLRFSDIIIGLSQGNILVALALIALASLLLGMGVPVTASYLIVAVLAVPALRELGVTLIAAHMIVYWFSQDSNITPPVCVAAYAGAAIAKADPWKTGWTSFKYAKLLYVMPVIFALNPVFLLSGDGGEVLLDVDWGRVVFSYVSAFCGTVLFSSVTMGYFRRKTSLAERALLACGAALCYVPDWPYFLGGLAVALAVYFRKRD